MHIVMVAAENGTLPGAKVGGIGDVIRDVPRALARLGHQVTVLTPGYQMLSKLPGARLQHTLTVEFSAALETLALYHIETPDEPASVRHMVLESQQFAACGAGAIYCHDAVEPFATDAAKFALFCHGACYALLTGAIPAADVLHLHDWHAALILLLRKSLNAYQPLQQLPAIFTIHNLSLQGIRPFGNNWSSPEHWFPTLKYARLPVADPEYTHCINLMRTGINLADKVHVVSPTYAAEILEPSHPKLGMIRGERLEKDLQRVEREGKLFGILNGCEYPGGRGLPKPPTKSQLVEACLGALEQWVGSKVMITAAHYYALRRLLRWSLAKQEPQCVVASVGRLTPQKVNLLQQPCGNGEYALDVLLKQLGKGFMIMLGSGDPACEQFMLEAMKRHDNFLFLCGFSESLADLVYRFCDLFFMPSSFEPCGISQMLAMRAGTPCLVHKVGGLADTVKHMENGFTFDGDNLHDQVQNMLHAFGEVLQLQSTKLPVWQTISRNAAAMRFSWDATVKEYESTLYRA